MLEEWTRNPLEEWNFGKLCFTAAFQSLGSYLVAQFRLAVDVRQAMQVIGKLK